MIKKMKKEEKCKDCGCKLKSKYLIRVDYDTTPDGNCRKNHWEMPNRNALVGWIKFVCNEMGNFEEMQIFNLMTECAGHREFHKVDTEKQDRLFPVFRKKKDQKNDRSFTIKQSLKGSEELNDKPKQSGD